MRRAGEFASLSGANIVTDGGGGFGGLEVDGLGVGMQGSLDLLQVEGLAVGDADQIGVATKSFSQRKPAFAEFSGGENEDAVAGRGEVADGGFHGSGTGCGEEQDVILGADELLQLGQNASVEGAELGGAVVDVRGGHGELGGGEEGGRTWSKKACFAEHRLKSPQKCGRSSSWLNHIIHTCVIYVNMVAFISGV